MTALALELCCTLMTDRMSSPDVGLAVRNKVLPQALTLVKSSLLQGQALMVPFMHLTVDFSEAVKALLLRNYFLFGHAGFTKLLCCLSSLCKYKFWHFIGLASVEYQTNTAVWWCCKTGYALNCSMCGSSLPGCGWWKMLVNSEYAYQHS